MAEPQRGDMGTVDYQHIVDMRNEVVREMQAGFAGIHKRQDITNGRIGTLETGAAKQDVRTTNLEREVFKRPRRREADDRRPITRWDVTVWVLGAGAVVGVIKLAAWLGPALMVAGKP